MIADILTIVWKEWKELFFQRAHMRAGWWGIAMIVVVFGVLYASSDGARLGGIAVGVVLLALGSALSGLERRS